MFKRLSPQWSALLEVGIMFIPAIPAYLWVWPVLEGNNLKIFQSITYLYVLAGTLWIGLRRWKASELGLNRKGWGISLASGTAVLLARTMIIWSVDWGMRPPTASALEILWDVVFYFGLVGLTEELLFRGLIYHALESWRSASWAIWGSSLGFLLWHVFGQGLLVGIASFYYGLIFALMRRRGGGILGLVVIHGLMDFAAARTLPAIDVPSLGRPEIPHPAAMGIGLLLLVATPLYLWMVHTKISKG